MSFREAKSSLAIDTKIAAHFFKVFENKKRKKWKAMKKPTFYIINKEMSKSFFC